MFHCVVGVASVGWCYPSWSTSIEACQPFGTLAVLSMHSLACGANLTHAVFRGETHLVACVGLSAQACWALCSVGMFALSLQTRLA